MRGRVLILDGHSGAGLSIVRSLGRRGLSLTVGTPEGERQLGTLSRYATRRFFYPDPMGAPEAFLDTVEAELHRADFDLLIPATEDTVLPLDGARARIEALVKLAIAPSEALSVALNKDESFVLAESLGVPTPAGQQVEDLPALKAAAPSLSYPVVIKPARSLGGQAEARVRTTVAYAHNEEELLSLGAERLKAGPVILQRYAKGQGVGIELLADRGEIVYAFQHLRHHELPLTGGGSCLRESVEIEPELLEYSKKLMRALSWHGVAMVEFKSDLERACLMEINGRFWGSLPLALAAGADFPGFLFDLLVHDQRPSAPPAKLHVFSRKLADDIYWHVQVLHPTEEDPLIRYPSKRQLLSDLFKGQPFRHHLDVQQLSDPWPGVVDASRTLAWFGSKVGAALTGKLAQLRAGRRRGQPAITERVKAARSVLFICYGNINRSAALEVLLSRELCAGDMLQIASAGFHSPQGRPADPRMIALAAARGVDLSAHRSRTVDAAMLSEAELVLVMELRHKARLDAEHPEAADKSFLLSQITRDPRLPLEIADPYDEGEAAYEACLDQLSLAAELFTELRG